MKRYFLNRNCTRQETGELYIFTYHHGLPVIKDGHVFGGQFIIMAYIRATAEIQIQILMEQLLENTNEKIGLNLFEFTI